MKAVGILKYLSIDEKDCFIESEIDQPSATGYDLLVKVKAVSVNPVDTKIRAPKPDVESQIKVLGWDASGEVISVGNKCTQFKAGDQVFYAGSIIRPGSNAELQLVDERIVGIKPKSLNHEEAAAMPLTCITAWESLFERLCIDNNKNDRNKNSSLLIIGGAGGVGSVATQIAKKVAGIGTVITTASREETRTWCSKMGADFSIDHTQALQPQLQAKNIENVDFIFCCSSTEYYFDQMSEIIKPQGSICSIVESKDDAPLPMNKLKAKSVNFCWELMFTKSLFETDDIENQHLLLNEISKLIDKGVLFTTLTDNIGPMSVENLTLAHKRIESGKTIGKIVLSEIQ